MVKVGTFISDNRSATNRSQVVKVNANGSVVVKEVRSEYKSNTTSPRPGTRVISARMMDMIINGR